MGWISGEHFLDPNDPMQKLVLGLVWGAGDPRDFDSGTMAGRCFIPRPYASLVKNLDVFLR